MDRAILLSPALLCGPRAPELKKGATVYLGDEFCIHKQASFADFAAAREKTGKNPVLVSTLLTEPAFEKYAALLAECAKKAPGTEIVVNDAGLLRYIDKKYRGRFSVTLGRLMTYFFDTKHTRLPGCTRPLVWSEGKGCAGCAGLRPGEKRGKIWETELDATPLEYIREFLKRYGVTRVETDSSYIFKKYAAIKGVKLSYYYPLRLMAMTRFCPFMGGIAQRCGAPCADSLVKLETCELDYKLYSKGNAYFAKNRLLKHPRLDRLVTLPSTPLAGFKPAVNKYSSPDKPV
ncbi:MAG: hypothetical protein A2X32_04185 [Elusimicrobia bacterium GWC2_64_44]|nr:MAG: hypothetical protein A2X32_04185 [Elusimicrobia bacterium GWC2_64_44]